MIVGDTNADEPEDGVGGQLAHQVAAHGEINQALVVHHRRHRHRLPRAQSLAGRTCRCRSATGPWVPQTRRRTTPPPRRRRGDRRRGRRCQRTGGRRPGARRKRQSPARRSGSAVRRGVTREPHGRRGSRALPARLQVRQPVVRPALGLRGRCPLPCSPILVLAHTVAGAVREELCCRCRQGGGGRRLGGGGAMPCFRRGHYPRGDGCAAALERKAHGHCGTDGGFLAKL